MANSLNSITSTLDLLGKIHKILPDTGGAAEDLHQPDQEEIEDVLANKDTGGNTTL